LIDNQWHFVALVVDRESRRAVIYVDGKQQGVVQARGVLVSTDAPAILGGGPMGSTDPTPENQPENYFLGDLDAMAIFSRALSKEEVDTAYRLGKP
jgi:hypothetical protein